jgi:hypothetical protein
LERVEPRVFISGRYFTAQEIEQIRETVRVFRALSWHELLQTICEHLDWVTPAGRYKVASCAKALEKLKREGLLRLPEKRVCRQRPQRVEIGRQTDPEESLGGNVGEVAPVTVEPVSEGASIRLWNEYLARYHRLGYRRPYGAHQRYFIMGGGGRRLGCLMFAASAWALAERDRWIGWSSRERALRLHLVVANTRFLLFPWVCVRNLASRALSLVARRIRQDWQGRYGYGPVLLETFVEAGRYRGTCYQAANWIRLGLTVGRGREDRHKQYLSTPKVIYVYPLVADFRLWLRSEGAP